jgi:hypothetical protein
MTTSVTLSQSWQEVAEAAAVFITGKADGLVHVGIGDTAPTGDNYHELDGEFRLFGRIASKVWIRADTDTSGSVRVDEFSGPMDLGSGLSVLSVSQSVSVVF